MLAPFIPVESFFDPALGAGLWPESIAAQVEARKKLIEYLETGQMAELYESLSDLLDDRDYRRLILYLPFEFLPNAPDRFRRVYMKAWRSLLSVYDVAANFEDGDILESEQRSDSLPRLVKAAQLAPKLVEIGWLSAKENIIAVLPKKSAEPEVITEKRRAWLEWKKKEKIMLDVGKRQLAGPFSENLKLMEKEMRDMRGMAASVQSNPELSRLIYPVFPIFGSRLAGYGEQDSDIDLAIFVRPGTPFSNRLKLQELLKKNFVYEKTKADEIIEFWLEEKDGLLKVRDFEEWDVPLANSYWAGILFGAAWVGNNDTISELRKKLLVPYLYDRGRHAVYLEDMERNNLQYRLLHKGYARFFPLRNNDGKGVFWDSGYRQLATRLFAKRVFLPKIQK